MHFDVVIVGYRLNAKEPAARALERILGLDPQTARRLARSFPATVRSHVTKEQAEDLMHDLSDAGAAVELHAEAPTGLHKQVPAAQPAARRTQATGRASLATSDKISLDLAPERAPTTKQGLDAHKPPPPPAAALVNYQLGDFGLSAPRRGASLAPNAALAVPSPPPPGPAIAGLPEAANANGRAPRTAASRRASVAAGTDLDLDFHAGMPLELDEAANPRASKPRVGSAPDSMLGERFSDDGTGSAVRGPQVEDAAYRSIQRRPRDSRRPGHTRAATPGQRALQALRAWAPSIAMLIALSAASTAAVGFALDPNEVVSSALRDQASALGMPSFGTTSSGSTNNGELHPLLRMSLAGTRGPLASMLRSRIQGVHEVEVVYHGRPKDFGCVVIEHEEGRTEARLSEVRATGHEARVPDEVLQQLRQRENVIRVESKRPALQFTDMCLTQ